MLIDLFRQNYERVLTLPEFHKIKSGMSTFRRALDACEQIYFQRSSSLMVADVLASRTFEEIDRYAGGGHARYEEQRSIGLWLQYEDAYAAYDGVNDPDDMVHALFFFQPSRYMLGGRSCISCYLIDRHGHILDMSMQDAGEPWFAWRYDGTIHQCLDCTKVGSTVTSCESCDKYITLWCGIMGVSLALASQMLAEKLYVEKQFVAARRTGDGKKGGSARLVNVVKYIDASQVTIAIPPPSPPEPESEPGGHTSSWLAAAEAAGLEVERPLITTRPFTRTYRAARYREVRGQTVEFPDGVKRHQPRLKNRVRVTKVGASKYEGGEENEKRD